MNEWVRGSVSESVTLQQGGHMAMAVWQWQSNGSQRIPTGPGHATRNTDRQTQHATRNSSTRTGTPNTQHAATQQGPADPTRNTQQHGPLQHDTEHPRLFLQICICK